MSEKSEDAFLRKWRETWKTEEGKDRLLYWFRRTPRTVAPGRAHSLQLDAPKQKTHVAMLRGRNPYTVKYMMREFPRLTSVFIGHDDRAEGDEVWMSPEQALSLLAWLGQQRETLEQLAKEQEK